MPGMCTSAKTMRQRPDRISCSASSGSDVGIASYPSIPTCSVRSSSCAGSSSKMQGVRVALSDTISIAFVVACAIQNRVARFLPSALLRNSSDRHARLPSLSPANCGKWKTCAGTNKLEFVRIYSESLIRRNQSAASCAAVPKWCGPSSRFPGTEATLLRIFSEKLRQQEHSHNKILNRRVRVPEDHNRDYQSK